jgi:hypothetical protein
MDVPEDSLPNLPYKNEYIQVLRDINEEKITYKEVQKPMTPMEEYHADVILEGVMVQRQNRTLKESVISPELSMNSIATHARDRILSTVRVRH